MIDVKIPKGEQLLRRPGATYRYSDGSAIVLWAENDRKWVQICDSGEVDVFDEDDLSWSSLIPVRITITSTDL